MHLQLLPKNFRFLFLCLILLFCKSPSFAEGTKQLDPNPTDYTKLMTNNASYGSFAEYGGAINSRMFIHIADPSTELVYLGLSIGAIENLDPNTFAYLGDSYTQEYYFRIVSPSGTIVYGPTLIDASSANVNSRADAIAGPAPVAGAGGYSPFIFDPSGMTAGDYYIEFSDNAAAISTTIIDIPFFDITVADNSGATPAAIDGRLWSYNWAFKTTPTINSSSSPYGNFDRGFNGVVYAYTDDGFVNKIDFANSGFRGWFFTIAFNALGTGSTGDVAADRKSVPDSYSVAPQYKIFFNDPDPVEYPDGTLGTITADPEVNICNQNEACIWIETSLEGQVEILLDINSTSGAGKYDLNSEDVLLLECISALPGEKAPYRRCVSWNGLNGFGNAVNLGSDVDVFLKLQQGVTHYASYDVEYVVDGYSIDIVRPSSSVFVDKLYYDDTSIPFVPGNGASQIELDGCTSPCHSWTNFDYGNVNTINTWWISHTSTAANIHIPWCVPTAAEDTSHTALNTAVLIDVLTNDQGTGLVQGSVNVTTLPENGMTSINSITGEITYTPASGFTGEDRFWYEVCDASTPPICDDTWVTIFINGITAINDDNNTLINQGISGNVLTNDVDNEGDVISLTLTPHVDPANGSVNLSNDGSYTYNPSSDYVGQDQFEYIICDNGTPSACDTATVVITVTSAPSFSNNEVIANADEGITNIDVSISANVLANDADVDGNNLIVNITPTSHPTSGTVSLAANGDFTYNPNQGFAGQDQFSYEVCDDGIPQACAGAVVVIDVIPDLNGDAINAPYAGDDFNLTNINTAVAGNLSTNDSGGGTITTTPINAPTNGQVTINNDGSYSYTPTTSYTGPDQFVYQSCLSGVGDDIVTNYSSTDIPININDNTITSTINISNGVTINDLNVTNLVVSHSWMGDLAISLTSPSNTTVALFNNFCGNNEPGYNITVDDEGTVVAFCSELNSGGIYQALNGLLSIFDGENSAGIWTLTITDNAEGDVGVLNSWGLEFESPNEVCTQATAYLLVLPDPVTDLDEDNDGIPDLKEVFSGDHDDDGTPDYIDPDFCMAVFQGVNGWDCSNGIPDPDFDLDGDGTPNYLDADYPYTIKDSDGDGYYDYLDLDSDNDGIPDLIEAGGTDVNADGLVDSLTDSDNDGLVDLYDDANALNPGVNEGTSLVIADTDNDLVPDFLDLDADNDGIPDLLELGGVDADGNGIVDNLTDSDTDGLVDLYDPSNESNAGSNEGIPHYLTGADSGDGTPIEICIGNCSPDGDGLPAHLDLDADDDGILDIIEAGGTDSNNDGMISDPVGTNGYSNGLDPADGGNPYFVATEDDPADLNTRPEYSSISGTGDSDEDDVLDFLDVDSDNDGIYDIYEAQETGNFLAAIGMDDDNDGIDNAFDKDSPLVTSNGFDPYNHDTEDQPDYLDTDSDNDNITDWQEAWDGLYDGDSRADNISDPSGDDADGDGLLDIYDNSDNDPSIFSWEGNPAEDINGNNGIDAGTLFSDNLLLLLPENGGDNLNQPDYRDQLIECGTQSAYYAISEMGGSLVSYSYNSASGKHEANANTGAIRATTYCSNEGWFYYYNPLEPTNILFAIKYNESNLGTIPINELVDYIELRLDADVSDRIVYNGNNALLVMARDWHVVFKREAEPNAMFDIKYYFDPAEFVALMDESNGLVGYGNPQLKWFKADQGGNISFNPSDITADSIPNMVDISGLATASVNMASGEAAIDTTVSGNGKNYIGFEGLPGFSGGTAVIAMSAVLPTELSEFTANEKDCEATLEWFTSSEENFNHFIIEKSRDGINFNPTDIIDSKGAISGASYSWNDHAINGNSYYRLKMVDQDGSIAYSKIASVLFDCEEPRSSIEIYPNPVQGDNASLHVICESPRNNPEFLIIDIMGQTLLRHRTNKEKGQISTKIDIGYLPPGNYFLVSRDLGLEFSKMFLKTE